jgi:hypothetical protein
MVLEIEPWAYILLGKSSTTNFRNRVSLKLPRLVCNLLCSPGYISAILVRHPRKQHGPHHTWHKPVTLKNTMLLDWVYLSSRVET